MDEIKNFGWMIMNEKLFSGWMKSHTLDGLKWMKKCFVDG